MAQPKLLLIPDYNAPIDHYSPFIRAVEDKFTVLTADLYGQGRSDPDKESQYSIDKFVREFEYVMDNQSWTQSKFHLVGHGLGATIALQLALNLKEKISSLTLVCPTGISFVPFPTTQPSMQKRGCLCAAPEVVPINIASQYYERVFKHFSIEL